MNMAKRKTTERIIPSFVRFSFSADDIMTKAEQRPGKSPRMLNRFHA
jgi:hypothetical protein